MPGSTFIPLLESDELLAELATASTTSGLLKLIGQSPIVQELHNLILTDAELIGFLEGYLHEAIYDECVSDEYVHPKTLSISVGLTLLAETSSPRGTDFLQDLGLSQSPKFFYCSRLARELFQRVRTFSIINVTIPHAADAPSIPMNFSNSTENWFPVKPGPIVEASYGG